MELKDLILESNLINFLIILAVLIFWALPFISKASRKEAERIKAEILSLEEAQKAAAEKLLKLEAQLTKSKQEAKDFLEEAKETAKQIREQILWESKTQISQMRELAQKDIEQSKNLVFQSIKQKVIDAAFSMSEDILKDPQNSKAVDKSLKLSLDKALLKISPQ